MSNNLITLTSNHYEITNKDLNKNLEKMVKALQSVKKGHWSFAKALYSIKVNQLYQDDFGTMENFYKAMDGIDKTFGSKCISAVDCLVNVLINYGYNEDNISVSNAYGLARLRDDLKPFLEKYSEVHFGEITQRKLEEMIREWKNAKDDAITLNETETEKETETETETKGVDVKAFLIDDLLTINIKNKVYGITLEELKEYEVKKN